MTRRTETQMPKTELETYLASLTTVPNDQFGHLVTSILNGIDQGYFGRGDLPAPIAVAVRSVLAERLEKTTAWRQGHVDDAVLRGVSRARIGSDTGAQSPNQVREAIRRLAATTVDTAAMHEGGNR